jgi:O-antigen/teichoic acid export membrane protein
MLLISFISVMGFADLGMGNGLMNAVAEAYGKEDRDLARECVASAFFLMLGVALLFTAIGAAGYPFLRWQRLFNVRSGAVAAQGARALIVLYGWFVVNIPLGVITRAQAGLQLGYVSQMVGALGNIVSLLCLLVVIGLHGDLPWLVLASTFGGFSAILLNGWLLFKKHPWLLPSWRYYRGPSARRLLQLGLMFFVLQCAVAIGFSSDNIVIAQILGAAAVAIYAVPQKLFSLVATVVSMAMTPLWPAYGEAIACGDVVWVRRVFLASIYTTLAGTIPLSALLAVAGPWILKVTVGKSLHAPTSLLLVLAIWAVLSAVSACMATLLNGTGVIKVQTAIWVVASVSNLALSICLTRRLGLIGVCLGSIIAQCVIVFPAYLWVIRNLFRKMKKVSSVEDRSGIAMVTQGVFGQ